MVDRREVRRPACAWAGKGRLLIGTEGSVIEGDRSFSLLLPEGRQTAPDIGFLAGDRQLGLMVWDRRSGDLLRFGRDMVFDRRLVSAKERRVDAVTADDDGTYYILDARNRTVTTYGVDGASHQIPVFDGTSLKKPDTLDVDFMGNIFVLDSVNREVGVFRPDGRRLAQASSGRTSDDPFPEPMYLAVNGRGDILLYDDRHEAIVVLR